MSNAPSPDYCVLVPLKAAAHAKSRLAPLGDEVRRTLVAALADDTVAAALATPRVARVLVVTDDHVLAARLSRSGAHVIPDGVTDDLNASLVQAAAEADRRWPGLGVAALCADLPALSPRDLDRALEVASHHRAAFVADTAGEGTTLLVASTPAEFAPRFGHGSRAAHLADGAHEISEVGVPTLRRDVDTPADLTDARELGVGPSTAAVVAGHRL